MEMAEATAYVEQRRRQVEENRRKLEELQLHHLSAAVREAAAAAKAWKAKQKRKAQVPLDSADAVKEPPRRSGRLASLQDKPVYNEVENIKRMFVIRDPNRVDATDEERSYAISKAQDLVQELGSSSSFPLFIKPMTHSKINCVPVPIHFCRMYLPECDETITVVDEDGNESDTRFLLRKKSGLYAGWRKFFIGHKLVDGDCLVFQLIERTKFKVYIIRASSYYGSED